MRHSLTVLAIGSLGGVLGCSKEAYSGRTPPPRPAETPWTGPTREVTTHADLFAFSGDDGKRDPDRMWELARPLQTGRFFLVESGEEIRLEGLGLPGSFRLAFDLVLHVAEGAPPASAEITVHAEDAEGGAIDQSWTVAYDLATGQEWIAVERSFAGLPALERMTLTVELPPDAPEGTEILLLRPLVHHATRIPELASLPPAEQPTQVVLVSLDTFRPDHLGCYGNESVATPNFDAFAAESVLFRDCYTAANVTKPAHMSIFTSLYVKDHGVISNKLTVDEDTPLLVDGFVERGFLTGAFLAYKGFDAHRTAYADRFHDYFECKSLVRRALDVHRDAFPWLASASHRPFFAWIHYYDAHTEYAAPYPFNMRHWNERLGPRPPLGLDPVMDPEWYKAPANLERAKALYKGEIEYLDHEFGRLVARLREIGVYDRAWIVVTADHGENLGEDDVYAAHSGLTDATTHVPLLIKAPRGALRGTVHGLVETIDVYPTLYDALDLEIGHPVRGRSLLPLMESLAASDKQRAFSEHSDGVFASVRTPRFRLRMRRAGEDLRTYGQLELFDYELGRGEEPNVIGQHAELADLLERELIDYLEQSLSFESRDVTDEEFLEQLDALGY